jgi:glycosyltransferase involved in cell wall biosynthesis
MKPFFSIIIPLFNSKDTLQLTLESVLAQDFQDYELILVDGLSTDGTTDMINTLQKEQGYKKVQVLSETDQGIYDAMNKGIRLAGGKWLYFMGGDDRLHGSAVLGDIYRELEASDCDLIYGNVYGTGSGVRYRYDTIAQVLGKGIHHQSIFYKASLFDVFGHYDLRFKIAADYHFTLKIFLSNTCKTRYTDLDIAAYGEAGYSSQYYDYTFYSYHYRFLSLKDGVKKIEDPLQCLEISTYCCLNMARKKLNLGFAWRNIAYYLLRKNAFKSARRIKILLQMIFWTFLPRKAYQT